MSRKNGRAHTNVLVPSPPDVIAMNQAVEQRFVEVLDLHLRVTGEEIVPPAHYDADMRRWREMAVRHRKGDFRNTTDEKKALKAIAIWAAELNAKLRNQEPPVIDWSAW